MYALISLADRLKQAIALSSQGVRREGNATSALTCAAPLSLLPSWLIRPEEEPVAQNQNLPAVGSFDDYLTHRGDDDFYMYGSYGTYNQFTIDSYWYAPFGYPVPIRSVSGKWHHEHPNLRHFRGFRGGIRRFATGGIRGGRR
jgi:hypothetical protein